MEKSFPDNMMITLENILSNETTFLVKIQEWKSNLELCDSIMARPVSNSLEETKNWLIKNANSPEQSLKGIFAKEGSKLDLLGIARLMYIDYESEVAEIGIYIGSASFRGKSVGSSALGQLIDIAKSKGLRKIFARIRASNLASVSLFRKKGFIEEGVLKKHYYSVIDQSKDDIHYYALFL